MPCRSYQLHRNSIFLKPHDNHTIDHRVADRRGETGRLASPFDPYKANVTPDTWDSLQINQGGDWDMPATPRVSGALAASRHHRARDHQPAADTGGCSTTHAYVEDVDNENEEAQGRPVGVKRVTSGWDDLTTAVAPHLRTLKRQDATLGDDGTDDRSDGADTWKQCGLSGNKTTVKDNNWGAPTNFRQSSTVTDQESSYERTNRYVSANAGRGNWNRLAIPDPHPVLGQKYNGNGDHFVDIWGATVKNPQPSIPVVPIDQKTIRPRGYAIANYTSTQGGNPGIPDRKPVSRTNPGNYDGNRAAADGSRVFYSAILPTVPTLQDIANHAEYTAWIDMLKSILKYHQLTPVVTSDANRPHGYTAARRWDQDRLRAAIIIKGALSLDVFEKVRQNGWTNTEDPTGTIEKVRETHGAVCPCGNSHGITLLDF